MGRTVITELDIANQRRHMGDGIPGNAHNEEQPEPDKYVDRLVKYVPPDVVAAYTAVQAIVTATHSHSLHERALSWVSFSIILCATPLYLRQVAKITKWMQIGICTIAYIAWACSFPGLPFDLAPDTRATIIILTAFLIPLLKV
jgi:hypothetical protein